VIPEEPAMTAALHVLTAGYANERVASTVTLLQDGDAVIVVDPGMVADRRLILDPLAALGLAAKQVTDVVFSHHHPDHTLNAALFGNARFHDHMAVYRDDVWTDRDAEGVELSPSVRLTRTPGHTAEDVSTLVQTEDGLVVLTHLWWAAAGPADDPFAPDREQLRVAREKVLAMSPVLIVPGHGAPFAPSADTPR
jgi:glyoxylase-like metal-dependent hydrolase (beta-lactamase superfamily II)